MSTRQGRRSLKLDGGGGNKKGKESSAKEEKAPDVNSSVVVKTEAEATNGSSSFFSPKRSTKKAATVTPSPSAAKKRRSLLQEEAGGETQQKRKRKKKKLEAKATTTADEEPYVPTYIHKNVGYARFGTATDRLTDGQKLAFNFVVEQYNIPSDFETNRKYGPLSGTSYEERVLAAYATNGLDPSEEADPTLIHKGICTFCGIIGHKKKLCPDLI
mmetsp:Transcript_2158/g.6258  ORF Transcript_2158/g.6258 Transcript_2158/m.6258 type:complete len:215 (+) Transcript_2158:118-762(+)|eukprot:CAMPEP_0181037738 /NCGR_PEP_ID=MMETSP1070-20121207/9564_1 /TAXON_ID=265543 /ORGANISM="Minutocellus polymorphus, Strain NH13" /LENGTH=214 /DNA_ID=CAMNT_0023115479 /DNA_START=35 /DNA_END=679 /DNA_ORIENTATION=+